MICGGLFLPFWYFVPCICIYVLLFRAPYELLVLAVCIDAEFGHGNALSAYWYTISVSLAIVIVQYLKPYLRFY